jgi:hypothetical protein
MMDNSYLIYKLQWNFEIVVNEFNKQPIYFQNSLTFFYKTERNYDILNIDI